MTDATLATHLATSLAHQYDRVRGRVVDLVTPLSLDDLWRKPYRYGNSVGHLVLHITGNLNYYVGARIAETGYVRDRPKEFADVSRRAKDDVLRDFNAAVDLTIRTLKAQQPSDWMKEFEATGTEDRDRLAIFIRCGAHMDHHLAQMILLTKELALTPA
jgi:uncharacterized damage-inducible protein DinB